MISRLRPSAFAMAWTAVSLASFQLSAAADDVDATRPRIAAVRVGFDGHYKVGYWTPVEVTLEGGTQAETGAIELLVADGDGMLTQVRTPPDRGVHTTPGRSATVLLYAKFGRSAGGLTVRYVVTGQRRVQRTFRAGMQLDGRHILYAMPTKDELILSIGPALGLAAAVTQPETPTRGQRHVVQLADIAQLPTRWYGYEGVDTLVFATSRPEPLRRLQPGSARAEALVEWVRQGGQLVLFAAANAAEVLSPQSPLADLLPAKFDRMVPLPLRPLETYCESSTPIELPRGMDHLEVPLVRDVVGRIELHGDSRPRDLPLVIRAAAGFGQVVLVLVDPDRPPLARWKGRDSFLLKVLGRRGHETAADREPSGGRVATLGYQDLTGQLRNGLDEFLEIPPVPFAVVAGLVVIYILLIGPIDYLIVKKWFKRMELTWITFPIWVLLFSVGAYMLAYWLKGDKLRVNQAELIDIDVSSGRVRGTTWTHLFSPRPDAYNLALRPQLPGGLPQRDPHVLLSWLGVPGEALGGMQAGTTGSTLFARPYRFAPQLDRLHGVPIQIWSTKSFVARWTTHTTAPLQSQLAVAADRTLTGYLTNTFDYDLGQCHLLYDRWVYRIASLPRGKKQIIGEGLQPRYTKTWLQGDGAYRPSARNVPRILNMMMFYAAAGGSEYVRLLNRYQSFCDLSGLLDSGRAILVARGAPPGSVLLRDDQPLASSHDQQWVFYRFVLPVQDLGP